jgi:hypothetical protein
MGAGFTDWDASIKETYDERTVKCQAFVDNVLLGTLPKERSGGEYFVQPIRYKAPGGSSASFSKAKTNGTASKTKKLNISRISMYQRVGVEVHLLLSADKKSESMVRVSEEFDDGFSELASKVERRLFRSSSGSIGQIKSTTTITSNTIILVDKADAFNFQEGDKIVASSADGGGSLRDSGDTVTVSGVDYDAGTFTVSVADISAQITGISVSSNSPNGDYLFQDGDYDACISGLESWLPVTNRSTKLAASFFGMTRDVNPVRLGGVYVDGTTLGGDANDILIKLISEVTKHGGKTDLVLCNTDFFADLQRIWITTRQGFESVEVSASDKMSDGTPLVVSRLYPGMRAMIGGCRVTIVPTRSCPSSRVYALQRDTWTIRHVGSSVPCFMLEEVEGEMLRLDTTGTEPEAEAWLAAFTQLGCSAPGKNGVAKVPVS